MTRQVADGGMASKVEGSCGYIEHAVAESRQAVVLQLGLGEVLTTPHCKTGLVTKRILVPRAWTDLFVLPKQLKKEMRFGTRHVKSLYNSITAAAKELTKYKLDLGVYRGYVRQRGTIRAEDYIFFYGKGNENHQLKTGFYIQHRTVSAVKIVDFVSDRI
jgi:hypothetical protein